MEKGEIEARFWSKVKKTDDPNECWEWQGTKNKSGYGAICIDGKRYAAHRLSWQLANNQEIPTGLIVCHHCDNPPCVNPNHLYAGTDQDNMNDMRRRNRLPRMKFSFDTIKSMRSLHAVTGWHYKVIGAIFGMGESQACAVINQSARRED